MNSKKNDGKKMLKGEGQKRGEERRKKKLETGGKKGRRKEKMGKNVINGKGNDRI